jgi:hypothetical protein
VGPRFRGRDMCISRAYAMYLPAALLRLRGDGGAADGEVLSRLRRALAAFVAERPYHNYTRRCVLQPLCTL